MNRRRVVILSALVALPLVVVGAACSFPDVAFSPISEAEGGPGTDANPSSNADGATDATTDRNAPIDTLDGSFSNDAANVYDGGKLPDASVREDGEAPVDPNVCNNAGHRKCDCDDDTYSDDACIKDGGGTVDAAGLTPGDCDDLDPVRNPGADFRGDVPDAATVPKPAGDWNCNKTVEYFPPAKLTCAQPKKNPGITIGTTITPTTYDCKGGGQGFALEAPACGSMADLYECPTDQGVPSAADCMPKRAANSATATVTCK